jgi:hypothetical protein
MKNWGKVLKAARTIPDLPELDAILPVTLLRTSSIETLIEK